MKNNKAAREKKKNSKRVMKNGFARISLKVLIGTAGLELEQKEGGGQDRSWKGCASAAQPGNPIPHPHGLDGLRAGLARRPAALPARGVALTVERSANTSSLMPRHASTISGKPKSLLPTPFLLHEIVRLGQPSGCSVAYCCCAAAR